jgi:hypothetical protein
VEDEAAEEPKVDMDFDHMQSDGLQEPLRQMGIIWMKIDR